MRAPFFRLRALALAAALSAVSLVMTALQVAADTHGGPWPK
jgi:hypothetical protein